MVEVFVEPNDRGTGLGANMMIGPAGGELDRETLPKKLLVLLTSKVVVFDPPL